MKQIEHNPDVLNCIANLSNDEVFTPPVLVNQMLDLLPQELFSDPNSTFLDPFTKTGVYLREIVKRLDKGLENIIPDRQERIDHILHEQVFGIAITELTALLSRRTLYCSKFANGEHSISHFDTPEGNIWYQPMKHTWENGKCKFCGASQATYDRGDDAEQYAYPFIHLTDLKSIYNMRFSVICGNPPYQLSFGIEGGNSSNSKNIYNLFIEQAMHLQPDYICMITPSRWLTRSAQGITDEWIDKTINSHSFVEMHDYLDSKNCFPGVDIKGGVNYFIWNSKWKDKCRYYLHSNDETFERYDYLNSNGSGITIRDKEAVNIINKIVLEEGQYYCNPLKNFSGLVSPKHFYDDSIRLTSNWSAFERSCHDNYNIKYYLNKNIHSIEFGWISLADIPKSTDTIKYHKIYITGAGGSGTDSIVLGKPFYGEPNSVCSQTYLVIGYDGTFKSKKECLNCISYIKSRFFRYLVSVKKKTQNGPRGVYQFVPLQDWSKPWTDAKLYKKYNLSKEEIDYIESMISPME